MARHFFRLKLALVASSLRRGWQHALGLVAGFVVGLPVAVVLATGLALASRTATGPSLLVLVLALLAVGWVIAPVLFFGLDDTLDPARLALLPLSQRQLLVGLTIAGAVGVPALATVVLLAAGLAYAGSPVALVLTVAALATHFFVCLWGGRALATALSATLRSRKGRDLAAAGAMLLGLAFAGLGQVPNLLVNVLDTGAFAQVLERAAAVVALTPPGWAAGAIVAAGEQRWLEASALLAAAVALAAALAWAWQAALQRTLSRPEVASSVRLRDQPLYPASLGWLFRGHLGASAAKELRYLARVPQLRVGLVMLALFGAAMVVAAALVDALSIPAVAYGGVLLAALQGVQAINLFGHDRGAVWLIVAAGSTYRADLAAKGVAHMLATTTVVVPVTVLLAWLTGAWEQVVPAIALAVALQGAAHGVGALASVLVPYPMPEGAANLWGNSAGMGCSTMLLQFVAFAGQGLLLAPAVVGVAGAYLVAPPLLPLVSLLVLVYGAGIWAAGVTLAAARLEARAPEFVGALSAEPGR